ncbi:MAG: cytochrome c peroxidase [Pseudomonadota bacterium]
MIIMNKSRRRAGLAVAVAAGLAATAVFAQPPSLPAPPSLKGFEPPAPDLSAYVADHDALLVLGKALFWDMGIGSNGAACATCHFHAGADSRVKSQISPGLNAGDETFSTNLPSGGKGGPNYTLKRSDFPLFQLQTDRDRNSPVTFETNDVVSSQGAYNGQYTGSYASTRNPADRCSESFDPVFHVGSENVRRVEPRNTPTVVNAVFYRRNFWDGRANNFFNGVSPFGNRDPNAWVVRHDGGWEKLKVAIPNLSLASQAVGPIMSDLEMICVGRSLAEFGKKVLPRQPLSQQKVHRDDSVLGPHFSRLTLGRGITGTYEDWVKKAFRPEWWTGGTIPAGYPGEGYSQMQHNFSLFWGIAVASYQATLISDDSKFDRVKEGKAQYTPQEALGERTFHRVDVGCLFCHGGPLFSNATTFKTPDPRFPFASNTLARVPDATGAPHLIDEGFFNLGVRPSVEDLGVGGTDAWGKPLSFAKQWIAKYNDRTDDDGQVVDTFDADACAFFQPFNNDTANGCRPAPEAMDDALVSVDGAFKAPMLRNVELTGPFFHYGAYGTLEEVMDFYRRGGDRRCAGTVDGGGNCVQPASGPLDTSGTEGGNKTNLSGLMVPLPITDEESDAIVAFLKTLTDERVRCETAPFDHPSLRVPHGIEGDEYGPKDLNGNGRIDEEYIDIPAVGAAGLPGIRRSCIGTFDSKLASD